MTKQTIKYAFRLVHIDNIPHVCTSGFVHKDSPNAKPDYVQIGDPSVINVRKSRIVAGGNAISTYIPFYFGPRSPMLYVIQHGYNGVRQYPPQDLVYCVLTIKDLIENKIDCVFTDGHALNCLTTTYQKEDLSRIDEIINFSDIYSQCWINEYDHDIKRRKEAELLIRQELGPQYIRGFVVYDEAAKERLIGFGINPKEIVIKKNFYF